MSDEDNDRRCCVEIVDLHGSEHRCHNEGIVTNRADWWCAYHYHMAPETVSAEAADKITLAVTRDELELIYKALCGLEFTGERRIAFLAVRDNIRVIYSRTAARPPLDTEPRQVGDRHDD